MPMIVFEGVDGSGKTTVATRLAKALDAKYIASPPHPFDALKQAVLDDACSLSRLLYFVASNIQTSYASEKLTRESAVVVDRHLWSTCAYYAAIEDLRPEKLLPMVRPLLRQVRLPDLVI